MMQHTYISKLRTACAKLRRSAPTLSRLTRIQAAVLCFTIVLIAPAAAFMRPAMRVTLDGKTIGYVDSAATLSEAVETIERSVSEISGDAYALGGVVELSPSLALADSISDTTQAVEALTAAADDVEMLAVLTVDGETVGACASDAAAQQVLNDLLTQYAPAEQDIAQFTEQIDITTTPAPQEQELPAAVLAQKLAEAVHVEVTSTLTYEEPIPFETTWVENNAMPQNTSETISAGIEGTAQVQAEVRTVNGEETARTVTQYTTLTAPQNAVVAFGTKNIGLGTGEMIAPLTRYRYTSGFKMRNGRPHKGADLCAPVGTPVYAADNGKVVVSEWSDSFGNYIVLDHGNGLRTLYAHNSALHVSVGDVVEKGGLIAACGNTGRSDGSHVHFEVHVNGTAVDPTLYVAL